MSLETITGNLREGYNQLQAGTMLHVYELINERRTNPDKQERQALRNQWFYTADGEIYYLDGVANPILAMTREAHNPVLLHIDDAVTQLTKGGNYHPPPADVQKALLAPDTVLVDLLSLRLSGEEAEWRYLTIGTTPAKYNKLNYEERKLAERVYGQGDDFAKNMKMLKDAQIGKTRIHVLNPTYVQKYAEEGAVARASWLNSFNNSSRFVAIGCSFFNHDRIRGVRKKTESLDTQARMSLEAGRAFEYKGRLYVPVSKEAGIKRE